MNIEKGRVCVSLAGRDKGKFLCVMSVDEQFVYVADGDERPLERPKKKNVKHIRATHASLIPEDINSNRSLKKALARLTSNEVIKQNV